MAKLIREKGGDKIIPFVSAISKRLGSDTGRFGLLPIGAYQYGSEFAVGHDFDGVYYMRNCVDGRLGIKRRFEIRVNNTPTINRLASQLKMRQAVAAWGLLTDPEKQVYNIRVKGKRLTGYMLFIKEYMLS